MVWVYSRTSPGMSIGRFLQQAAAGGGSSKAIPKLYAHIDTNDPIVGVTATTDGGIAWCGYQASQTGTLGLIDADGAKVWDAKITATTCRLQAITTTENGDIVAAGWCRTSSVSDDTFFVTCHSATDGSVIWQNLYHNWGAVYSSYANDIIRVSNGNLVVVGNDKFNASKHQAVLYTLDPSDGSLVGSNQHYLRRNSYNVGFSGIFENTDGTLSLAGAGQVSSSSDYGFLATFTGSALNSVVTYVAEPGSGTNPVSGPCKIAKTSDGTTYLLHAQGRMASFSADWSTLNVGKVIYYGGASCWNNDLKVTSDDKLVLTHTVVGKSPDYAVVTVIDQSSSKILNGADVVWNTAIYDSSLTASSNADHFVLAIDSKEENFVAVGNLAPSGSHDGWVISQSLADGGGYSNYSLQGVSNHVYRVDESATGFNNATQTIGTVSLSASTITPTVLDVSGAVTFSTNQFTHNIYTW